MKGFYILGFVLLSAMGSMVGQTTITIAEQNFDGATTWNYESDIPFFNCSGGTDFLGIRDVNATGLDFIKLTTNILSEQDLESPCGTAGEATISFPSLTTTTDISSFTDVTVSFDYDVEGYNANSDEAHYELFYDGVGQGRVVLQTGSTPGDDSEGSVSVNVPGTVNNIRLEIILQNNGGSGEAGFDNFLLEGASSGSGPTVGWDNATSTETETNSTQTVLIPVTLSNYSQNVDLDVAVTGGTAEMGDYTLNTTSLSFTGNGTQNVSIDINDDADFDDETVEITLTESTSTMITISPDVHTLTISDDESPPTPQILITEVGDPADNTGYRMVEICNRGSSTVDISNYSLEGDFNGNTTVDFTIDVTGSVSLAPGECFVFGNNNFPTGDLSDCIGFELSGNISSNGNETFWLNDGTSQIDVYDGFAGLDFENSAATRNSGIMDPNNTFTAGEWTVNSANAINLTPCIDPNFLPVTWIAIEAYIEAKSTVNINWQTAEERNNDHFVVQHSTNGTAWSEIGKVKGAGNSNTLQSYRFTHLRAERGTNFYRIQQVDIDGSSSFSPVVLVQLSEASVEPTHAYKIYPNPTQDFIQISGREFSEINAVRLFDQWGKLLLEWRNNIPQVLPITTIPAGVYLLQIQDSNQELNTQRIIKID